MPVRRHSVTGLYGKDDMEQARSDMIIAYVDEIFTQVIKVYLADTEEKKVCTLVQVWSNEYMCT